MGQMGANSLTSGLVSAQGRVLNGVIYDQSSAVAFPGSSGGLLSLKTDGRVIGVVLRGAGEGFNLYCPARRLVSWAKKTGVGFAVDDSIPVPSNEELSKLPVDDGVFDVNNTSTTTKSIKEPKFLIMTEE